jgi:hypothetical protein
VLFALSVVKKSDRLRALKAKSTENDEVVEFYEETKPFGALGVRAGRSAGDTVSNRRRRHKVLFPCAASWVVTHFDRLW